MAFFVMREREGRLLLCPDRREKKTLAGAGIAAGFILSPRCEESEAIAGETMRLAGPAPLSCTQGCFVR